MRLKFWGVRGSIPSPLLPTYVKHKIELAMQEAARRGLNLQNQAAIARFIDSLPLETSGTIGGNTTCVTIENDTDLLIFDAGSGMRNLSDALMRREFAVGEGHAHILFTHTHWDHIQGFPFFVPLSLAGNRFDIYHVHPYVPDVLAQQMSPYVFPNEFKNLQSQIRFHQLAVGEPFQIGDLTLNTIALNHPGTAYAYRMDSPQHRIVLATDAEYKQLDHPSLQRYFEFYRHADALIFDAQFSVRETIIREDWGHSSALVGADIARAAGAKRLMLFHHNPTATDDELVQSLAETREYITHTDGQHSPLKVDLAREGWEIDFCNLSKLSVEETQLSDAHYVALGGQFDGQGVPYFTRQVLQPLQQNGSGSLILDFDHLTELSVAGIHALLDARRDAFSMALVNVPPHIYRVLELAGTADFFPVYDSLEAALNAA